MIFGQRLVWRPAAATLKSLRDRHIVLAWSPEDLCAYSVYRDGGCWMVAGGQGAVISRDFSHIAEVPTPR